MNECEGERGKRKEREKTERDSESENEGCGESLCRYVKRIVGPE